MSRVLLNLPAAVQRAVEHDADEDGGDSPLWSPYPGGPQEQALESKADIIGYGGAAGGGKTDLLLGAACTRHHDTIIFRRVYPNLKGIIKRGKELFAGHARWNGQDKIWVFPDGRNVELGAVQYEDSKYDYRGRAHDLKAFDEATEFPESVIWFLIGWMRSTIPGQQCRTLLTFNPPTTTEGQWVIRAFAPWLDRKHPNPAAPGDLRWFARIDDKDIERPDGTPFEHEGETIRPLSRTFFPARLADNPALATTSYGATLQALPEPLRSQLLYGDFDIGLEADPWQVIPTAWVEAAMERWRPEPPGPLTCLGVDVAHGGKDKTVIAPRHASWIGKLKKYAGKDTPDGKSAAALVVKEWQPKADINVDAIGYGASCAEKLRDARPEGFGIDSTQAVNVAERSEFRDRSKKYRMVNKRAEMYWRLREALDPESKDEPMALPPDPELKADLTAPKYEVTTGGIKIEPKEDIAARLGRSPDCGDGVAITMLRRRVLREIA